ncbi:MAG: hypothetical protein KJ941_07885 [Bacteroidetes bacterium]|nr:hypothetical protein [Bacteroidota bacterium]
MRKTTLLAAIAIIYSSNVVAQERVKKYEIGQFLIETGQFQRNQHTLSRSQLGSYNDQSLGLRNLASLGDTMRAVNFGTANDKPGFEFHLLFNRVSPSKFQQRLKLGLGISTGTLGSAFYRFEATGRYDTLTSSQNGTQTYIDTTYTRQLSASHSMRITSIQAGYEWHYQPEKRWHWYMGTSLALGVSTQSTLQISEYIYSQSTDNQNSNSFQSNTYDEINLSNPVTLQRLSGQFGLDFRISKKDNFFGKSFLRFNAAYALTAYQSELTKSTFNSGFGFHLGYGFKFQAISK